MYPADFGLPRVGVTWQDFSVCWDTVWQKQVLVWDLSQWQEDIWTWTLSRCQLVETSDWSPTGWLSVTRRTSSLLKPSLQNRSIYKLLVMLSLAKQVHFVFVILSWHKLWFQPMLCLFLSLDLAHYHLSQIGWLCRICTTLPTCLTTGCKVYNAKPLQSLPMRADEQYPKYPEYRADFPNHHFPTLPTTLDHRPMGPHEGVGLDPNQDHLYSQIHSLTIRWIRGLIPRGLIPFAFPAVTITTSTRASARLHRTPSGKPGNALRCSYARLILATWRKPYFQGQLGRIQSAETLRGLGSEQANFLHITRLP